MGTWKNIDNEPIKYYVFTVNLIWQKGQRGCEWESWGVFAKGEAYWTYGDTSRASGSHWEFIRQDLKLPVLEFDVRTRASGHSEQWYDLWLWFQERWKSIWILSRHPMLSQIPNQSNNQMKLWRDQARRDLFSPKLLGISTPWSPCSHKAWGRNWGMFAYLIWVWEEHIPSQRRGQRQSRLQSRKNQDQAYGARSLVKRNSRARPDDPDWVRSPH